MKRILLLIVVSTIMLTSCSSPGNNENNTSSQKTAAEQSAIKEDGAAQIDVGLTEGKMAPDFTLKDIDGKDIKLSDYSGKTVVLNFFGVWCVWCRKEMPGFMNVYKDYNTKNVEFVIVDSGDDRDTLVNYLKENNFNVKPLMDNANEVVMKYRVAGFPTTYIIDEKGIIRKVHSGFMDEGLLRTILGTIVK